MIKDLWNSIRLYIEDRLSSPLLTGFLFAWSIINYRFFLILFSNERFIEKIALIEQYVFPSADTKLYKGFIYPLAAALIYVLIYPFIDRLIFAAWRWHQHKLIQLRQRIDEERPLSEKDRTQLLSRIYDAERKKDEELQWLETTIESQRVRIKELEDQASAIAQDKTTSENELSPGRQDAHPEEQSLLEQPLTLDALSSYVTYRFPNKPVGEDILKLLLRDIDKGHYRNIRDLDNIVERAANAVAKYEKEKPEWFTKGADYLTKSLGFIDKSFRATHHFAPQTKKAFAKYDQQTSTERASLDRPNPEDLSSLQINILEAVANAEREGVNATEQFIRSKIGGDIVENKYNLDNLTMQGYFKQHYQGNGEEFYALSHDGRRVLLALGKAGKSGGQGRP